MINFSLSDIRLICDSSTFSRGYDYNEASLSCIKSVSMLSDDIMQILSTTQGSKLYKQTINIYAQEEGVKVIGKCSCPVGRNCKHVVSSALAYLDEQAQEPQSIVPVASENEKDLWLKKLRSTFVYAQEDEYKKSTVLLYSLHLSKNEKEIELSVYTARKLKDGGYGKVNRARANSIFNPYKVPEYIRESDKEVILLFKFLSEGVKTTAALKGKLGALVLEAAISTKRCFWQKAFKKELSLSDERELKLSWLEDLDYSKLILDLGEKSFLCQSTPALYIDSKNKTVGKVQTQLEPQQLELFLSAPAISKDELDDFVFELNDKVPSLKIEAPSSIDLETLECDDVVPCLHLTQKRGEYILEIGFKYKEFYVKAYPAYEYFVLIDKKIRIKRDLHKEKIYISLIENFGFKEENNTLKAQSLLSWKKLLDSLDELASKGFEINKDISFKLDFHNIDKVDVKVEQTSHWFNLGMHINLEGKELPLLPIISTLLEEGTDLEKADEVFFELEQSRYISLPSKVLRPILNTFYELLDKPNAKGFKLHKYEAHLMQNFNNSFDIKDDTLLKKLREDISKKPNLQKTPKALKATLREYQEEGVAWMQFLRRYGFGGILADDMGLGKTIQSLANLQIEKEQNRLNKPALIVSPTSLIGNWKNEAKMFTPDLRVGLYYGSSKQSILEKIDEYDLIITSYTLLALDIELLKQKEFYYFILDEAQRIKNPRSESAKSAKLIQADFCLALSGTPMENHLGELHSIFDTVMPGFLAGAKEFKTLYQNPIEKEQNKKAQEALNKRISPFMLRRTKQKVAKELPPKIEIVRLVDFGKEQARLYETIRVSMQKSIRKIIKTMGLAQSHISILAALLKLRQACCDPRLLNIQEAQNIKESAKLQMLTDLVLELKEEGRSILIFSQFTSMLDIIESKMIQNNISYNKLTGSTRKRQEQIDEFNSGKSDVFLISLKAGGVGLNLTQADTVIHYDPWWNPATQDQATDRAYRIGQDKPVFVYKLIVQNSVEQKIMKMQEEKRSLAEAIYSEKELGFKDISEKDLLDLFS